jgi:biotin transport system substrate-specific component
MIAVREALIDAAWPGSGVRRDAILILGGAAALGLLAQVQIPLQPVPVTGQTFGVLLIGALLGSRRGALSMLSYLTLGAAGLPVFAGLAAGSAHFVGPTGGYLAGFVLAAGLVGWLAERGWNRRIHTTALAMLIGTVVIYVPGIAWLSTLVGWGQVLQLGVYPFLLGDALKVVLAALALPWGWRLTGRAAPDR